MNMHCEILYEIPQIAKFTLDDFAHIRHESDVDLFAAGANIIRKVNLLIYGVPPVKPICWVACTSIRDFGG